MKKASITKLIGSLAIDAVGIASYLIPGLAELSDTAWAPISGFLIFTMYGNGPLAILGFGEEILPGTDIIPTATIAWILEKNNKL